MRLLSVLIASSLVAGAASVVLASPAQAAAPTPKAGTYVAVTPFRAVDTRTGKGTHQHPLAHGAGFVAAIGGRGHVPKRVGAVAITITAISPSASGALTAYPANAKRPAARNLLYRKHQSSSVAAIVRLSSRGKVAVFNFAPSGSTQVVIDVSGYYVPGKPSGSDPGTLHTVTPARVLAPKRLASHGTTTVAIGGHRGVPSAGVGAVAVSITALAPARSGGLVAYAAGADRPGTTTMSFAHDVSVAESAIVQTDAKGRISIYNASAGRVRLMVDVTGYFVDGLVTTAGTLQARVPARIVHRARLAPRKAKTVTVGGRDGVPLTNVSAALVTLTISGPKRDGAVVAWRAGSRAPKVAGLQYQAGKTESVASLVPVSREGTIAIRNSSKGAATVSVDINGYVPRTTITPPSTSTGRYVRNISDGGDADQLAMHNEGCDDALAGSTLVLLELGAQLNDKSGVQLSGTTVPITYAQLQSAINAYLEGFANCAAGAHATIALGTNNDADFTVYTAAERGSDWADKVVDAVTAQAGLTVVGANDIEPNFFSTREQAQEWEEAFLAATSANLIFNGSADGCSSTYGQPHGTCDKGYTQQTIYNLAHNGTRIQALPQIYNRFQAAQWANIDQTGGGAISFAGSLTEFQACPVAGSGCPEASFRPAQGWAALQHAISTVVRSPKLPAAVDLRVDE